MTKFIYSNGSVLMADHDESGKEETEPNFPFEVVMVPVNKEKWKWNERDVRFYDYIPENIKEGTHLFDVMVRDKPTDHHDDPDSW